MPRPPRGRGTWSAIAFVRAEDVCYREIGRYSEPLSASSNALAGRFERSARGLLRGQHARSLAQIVRRLRCAHYFGRGTGQKERAEQQGHLAAAERHTNRYDREAECEPVPSGW